MAISRPIAPGGRGKGSPTPLAAILGPLVPELQAPRPRGELSPIATIGERIARLEALELELFHLLANSAPLHWLEIRRPLTRLLRRSRRALRALERSAE